MLVNGKQDEIGSKRITFQGYKRHWPSQFIMAHLKQSWQHWYSCIVESL